MSKNLKFDVVERIPQWAACGFVNGDWSGVPEADAALAQKYEKDLNAKGWQIMDPMTGSENEFCPHPAFGDACETVDFNIMKVESPES